MKRRLLGLAATAGLIAILIGMPVLLIAAHPLGAPRLGWTWQGLWQALSRPDDGTLLLTGFKAAGWISWAILTTAIAVELGARLRRLPVPHLPGFALPQALARGLVATAAAAFITAHPAAPLSPVVAAPAPALTMAAHTLAAPLPETPPQHAAHSAKQDRSYSVVKGDTLSEIALDHYGDASKYPRIFKANKGQPQPGGRTLTDPDEIDIGWTFTIPGTKPGPARVSHDRATARQGPRPATPTPTPGPTTVQPSTVDPATPSSQQTPASTQTPTSPGRIADQPGHSDSTDSRTSDRGGPEAEEALPGWMLTGLTGAGALLAGSLWLALRSRRAAQRHARNPGRALSPPPAALAPIVKTLIHQGRPTGAIVLRVHDTLRRLTARLLKDNTPLPRLMGVDVTPDTMTLRLYKPATLPAPWQPDPEQRCWTQTTTGRDPDQIGPLPDPDAPSPWPQLVTLGADQHGWRLLNLEELGSIHLTGDPLYAEDLARYLISELAISPWSRDLRLDCLAIAQDGAAITDRVWHHTDPAIITETVAAAVATTDRLSDPDTAGLDTARARQIGDQLWDSRLLITATPAAEHLDVLREHLTSHAGRTAACLISFGAPAPERDAIEIELTGTGRLRIPHLGLDLVAAGLTRDEAMGCTAVLRAVEDLDDHPMPATDEPAQEWEQFANEAGQLRPHHTLPRDTTDPDAVSLLPEPDPVYLATTANTGDDLAALAPRVPADLRSQVEASDPTLDDDLAAWHGDSCVRPRLTVLGSLRVRVGTTGHPTLAAARYPYYAEIVAYLANRPHGATTEEVAEAMCISVDKVRRDVHVVRAWLGENPHTGMPFLPGATKHPLAVQRGRGLYLIDDLLCDADLFRRLRVRGEARGADGIGDLLAALRLVTGKPYDDMRARGGAWLTATAIDQNLLCAIVDVAHIVTTHALQVGDIRQARAAAELATLAAPEETTPRLDLAAIAAHQGRPTEAYQIAKAITDWRDAAEAPEPVPERAQAILKTHRWLETTRAS